MALTLRRDAGTTVGRSVTDVLNDFHRCGRVKTVQDPTGAGFVRSIGTVVRVAPGRGVRGTGRTGDHPNGLAVPHTCARSLCIRRYS